MECVRIGCGGGYTEGMGKNKSGTLQSTVVVAWLEVCGDANASRKRNGSEWWGKGLRVPIKEKKVAYGRMKQNGAEKNRVEYKERSRIVKEREGEV